jgi:anti-sigma B factor antagonist
VTPLTIEHRTLGTSHILVLTGDLDMASADDLRDVVRTVPLGAGQLLMIDLARVKFCDSSGFAALVAARNRALAARAEIALAAVPQHIARVLQNLGLDAAFPMHPTAEAPTDDSGAAPPDHIRP